MYATLFILFCFVFISATFTWEKKRLSKSFRFSVCACHKTIDYIHDMARRTITIISSQLYMHISILTSASKFYLNFVKQNSTQGRRSKTLQVQFHDGPNFSKEQRQRYHTRDVIFFQMTFLAERLKYRSKRSTAFITNMSVLVRGIF